VLSEASVSTHAAPLPFNTNTAAALLLHTAPLFIVRMHAQAVPTQRHLSGAKHGRHELLYQRDSRAL
jgi:hypothetical protein